MATSMGSGTAISAREQFRLCDSSIVEKTWVSKLACSCKCLKVLSIGVRAGYEGSIHSKESHTLCRQRQDLQQLCLFQNPESDSQAYSISISLLRSSGRHMIALYQHIDASAVKANVVLSPQRHLR